MRHCSAPRSDPVKRFSPPLIRLTVNDPGLAGGGSSRQSAAWTASHLLRNDAARPAALQLHDAVIKAAVEANSGELFATGGDGFAGPHVISGMTTAR